MESVEPVSDYNNKSMINVLKIFNVYTFRLAKDKTTFQTMQCQMVQISLDFGSKRVTIQKTPVFKSWVVSVAENSE